MAADTSTLALTKVADSFVKELFQSAKGIAVRSMGKFQAEFGVGFETYIKRNQNKCRFVKTLLHRIEPIPIERAYVDPSLKVGKKTILGSSFPEHLNELKNIIIVGSGGSGKSMFLKKLFLDICEYPVGRIPLFVELRDINTREDRELIKLIYHQWSELIPSFTFEALEAGFRSGKFFLLLDGLDEVDRNERQRISKSIVELSYKFPSCPIVLTSRPIDDFAAWHEFHTAEILPFDLPRITELVDKTDIDAVVKSKFLGEVKERLFRSHKTFLANPLLCTMMILTYTEFEEIPSKMHIFYARAFDVLFTRHDKTKTFFVRKFYTALAEDDFKRLFSTFCLFSYIEGAFTFERDAALRFIELAIEFEGLSIEARDFLSDMHESISILVRDGDTYSFLHRSFQEYFSAVFLSDRQVPRMTQLFERVLKNHGDNVLYLLFEMNRDALESKFLAHKVRQLRNELVRLNPKRSLPKMLSLLCSHVYVSESEVVRWGIGPRLRLVEFLSETYGLTHPEEAIFGLSGWEVLANGKSTKVSSIPHARIKNSDFYPALVRIRTEIIGLEKSLREKGASRDGFVVGLLRKKRRIA